MACHQDDFHAARLALMMPLFSIARRRRSLLPLIQIRRRAIDDAAYVFEY